MDISVFLVKWVEMISICWLVVSFVIAIVWLILKKVGFDDEVSDWANKNGLSWLIDYAESIDLVKLIESKETKFPNVNNVKTGEAKKADLLSDIEVKCETDGKPFIKKDWEKLIAFGVSGMNVGFQNIENDSEIIKVDLKKVNEKISSSLTLQSLKDLIGK